MKLYTIYKIVVGTAIILPLVLTTSCKKDFLETFPKANLPEEVVFDTPDRVLGIVNSMYAGLKNGQFLGGRFLIYQDIRGEEFINALSNGVTGQETWRFNLNSQSTEVNRLWVAAYLPINKANILLDGLDKHPNVVTAALADQYKGEAKFVRAISYFELLQLYARPFTADNGASLGVPLRLKAETTSANNDLARNTVAEVYAQIIKDLDEAESTLPATYSTTDLNISRAHKNTVIALKTRVYLTMGNYAKVVQEAMKMVSATAPFQAATGVNNKLEPSFANLFTGNYNGPEAVLSMIMTNLDFPGTQNQLAYYYNVSSAGGNKEYFLNPTGIFSNSVFGANSTDARKAQTAVDAGNTYLIKYKTPSPYTDYVPVIRYAEVLLNYAEAAARTNDLAKATALLNAVRQRSDAVFVFPAADIDTQNALINTILTERRIELLGEGFRSSDLMRLNQDFPAKGTAQAVPSNSSAYIWPIPSAELQNNHLMTPNP